MTEERERQPDEMDRLRALVGGCAWLMGVLAVVRDIGLPDAWVGAGVVRDLVWGELSGRGFRPGEVRDIDVVYFDPADLTRERDDAATALLCAARPGLPWEARNQAAVHTWYARRFGGAPVPPFASIAEAVGRRNPARVSLAISRERLARHRPTQRWPGIRVIAPE